MRVKICGLTTPEDALMVETLGADALGLVFVAGSKRRLDLADARRITAVLGPFITRVGVFADMPLSDVSAAVDLLGLDAVQLHGREEPAYAAELRRKAKVIKAVSFASFPTPAALDGYPADAILLDAPSGGSGTSFDWDAAAAWRGWPNLIVAGGLDAANVVFAAKLLAPYAVDVSSGVESSPGSKSPAKVAAFISAARLS